MIPLQLPHRLFELYSWACIAMLLLLAFTNSTRLLAEETTPSAPHFIIAVGAPGAEEYGPSFREWAERWESAAKALKGTVELIGIDSKSQQTDRELLLTAIEGKRTDSSGGDEKQNASTDRESDLWIVLLGHGTFNANVAKFNLSGPDLSAAELNDSLKPLKRRVIVVNCTSSSGPFINILSGPRRAIITATRSGVEENYARLGEYLSAAISDPSADLDHDRQISLLEAFLSASGKTQQFYTADNRLATEHALLDDNGDGKGTPANFYRGIRPVKTGKSGESIDGSLAATLIISASPEALVLSSAQKERSEQLEDELRSLQKEKQSLGEDDYYSKLEVVLKKLAQTLLEGTETSDE